jgi:hypothetical protein
MRLENGKPCKLQVYNPIYDATRDPQTVSLGEALRRSQQMQLNQEVLTHKGRLILAVILANALLPFLGTSWLSKSWNRDSIIFFYHRDEGRQVNATQPFLISNTSWLNRPNFESEKADQPAEDIDLIHPIPTLLSLAVLLCELEMGRPIETQFGPEDFVEGKPSINATFYAVEKVLKKMENSVFEDYRGAIEALLKYTCIPGSTNPRQVDFGSETLRQSIYDKVVRPLERTLYDGFRVKVEQLDELDHSERVQCWGSSDPYRASIPVQENSTLQPTSDVSTTTNQNITGSAILLPHRIAALAAFSNLQQLELFDVSGITQLRYDPLATSGL